MMLGHVSKSRMVKNNKAEKNHHLARVEMCNRCDSTPFAECPCHCRCTATKFGKTRGSFTCDHCQKTGEMCLCHLIGMTVINHYT